MEIDQAIHVHQSELVFGSWLLTLAQTSHVSTIIFFNFLVISPQPVVRHVYRYVRCSLGPPGPLSFHHHLTLDQHTQSSSPSPTASPPAHPFLLCQPALPTCLSTRRPTRRQPAHQPAQLIHRPPPPHPPLPLSPHPSMDPALTRHRRPRRAAMRRQSSRPSLTASLPRWRRPTA